MSLCLDRPLHQEGVFYPLRLALGRGLELDHFIASDESARKARGRYGPSSGVWTVELDENTLLRSGTFSVKDREVLSVATSGTRTAKSADTTATIAETGQVIHHLANGPWILEATVTEFTLDHDRSLAAEAAAACKSE